MQRICDRLGSGVVQHFLWRWLRRLPSPFTPDDLRAGYTYELAFRQFEVSDTRVFDRPQAGRAFVEGVIRDHLDVGRPSSVALIFDRKITARTPGGFRTKVITRGVDPQVSCTYKSSRIKQYFKQTTGRCAPKWWLANTPTSVSATFKRPTRNPLPTWSPSEQVTRPSNDDGLHAPGLRFRDRRVMAVLAATVGYSHLIAGSTTAS